MSGFEFPLPCRLYGTSVHGADVEDCETMEDVQAFLRHPHYGQVQIVTGDDPRTWTVVPEELCNLHPIGDRDADEDDTEEVA